jgi:citrate lyase beta subunit
MRARRALLYMPGDSQRKIEKALTLDADSVCMDLEDGVAASQKAAARETVRRALATFDFGRSERLVRINSVGSGLEAADLAETISGKPDGIVLPKVEQAAAIAWLDEQITGAERAQSWTAGEMAIIAIVETARGIINLGEICAASPRLQALIFGAEDLAADIDATRTREGAEVFYARSSVVMWAAAHGLQAIDMVFVNYQDPEGLAEEARQGAQLGYAGKQAIHPGQVGPIQSAFTPSTAAIAYARRIVRAAAENEAAGLGAFAVDGKMVDAPVIRAAWRVLEKARAASLAPDD